MSTRDESRTTGTAQGCQCRELIVSWHVRPEEEREPRQGKEGGVGEGWGRGLVPLAAAPELCWSFRSGD